MAASLCARRIGFALRGENWVRSARGELGSFGARRIGFVRRGATWFPETLRSLESFDARGRGSSGVAAAGLPRRDDLSLRSVRRPVDSVGRFPGLFSLETSGFGQ